MVCGRILHRQRRERKVTSNISVYGYSGPVLPVAWREEERVDPDALTVRGLSEATWNDFEDVLGKNGGARGCWCMHWRLSIAEWMAGKGDGNMRAMRELLRCESRCRIFLENVDD